MFKPMLMITAGVLLIGCGEKSQEAKNAANVLQAVASAAANAGDTQKEAEQFYNDRKAKGDTVAMPYADLQKMLPGVPSGYAAAGEPGGSSQSMGGWSMSQAEQTYSGPAGADGNAPTIKVTLVDLGGTQAAYGMMALPMMMNFSQEDAHHKFSTVKLSPQYTWASEEYNKDSKEVKVTAVTRYRYMITVEARNHSGDETANVKALAEAIVRRFEGK